MAAPQIDQGDHSGHPGTEGSEPDRGAGAQQDPVGVLEFADRPGHQQAVCAELLALEDNTVPSLAVIEQFSLLTRNRLEASTDPTSELEIGVIVKVHGM